MDNKIKQISAKNKGFSLKELLIVLALGGTCIAVAASYYNKFQKQTLRKTEINATTDYAKAVAAFAHAYQVELYKNTYSGNVVTISPQKLVQYGYLKAVNKIKDPISGAQIYPCASIYFTQEKLQGMVYYRTDSDKLNGTDTQKLFLSEGLKAAGNDGGFISTDKNNNTFIQNNFTKFILDNAQINKYFPKAGSATLLDDGLDSCQGAKLAVPSYTSYMANVLGGINSELNPDNTVKQNVNEIVNDNPNNSISQLNMDGTSVANASLKNYAGKNKIVFQSNEDCQMNPEILSTMQDYNPDCPGSNCNLSSSDTGVDVTQNCNVITDTYLRQAEGCGRLPFPNKFGCRNKQLSLGYSQMQVSNGNVIAGKVASTQKDVTVINGFDEVSNTYSASENGAKVTSLGKLRAQTAQATAIVDYAQACDQTEIGGIAKQKDYKSGGDNLSKLYSINQSVMICQKNALCNNPTGGTAGYCWLPLMPITVKVNFSQADKVLAFKAPAGFFIQPDSVVDEQGNITNINAEPMVGATQQFQPGNDGGNINIGVNSKCQGKHTWGPFGCCSTDSRGWFATLRWNATSDNIYYPFENMSPSNNIALNGWNVMTGGNGNKAIDIGFYVSSAGGGNTQSHVSQNGQQSQNWQKYSGNKLSYRDNAYPVMVNSKWNFRQSVYDAATGDAAQWCTSWHGYTLVAFPYYIRSVVISNDTSLLAINNYNPIYVPPVVNPTGTCNATNIPQNIKDASYLAANNLTYNSNGESVVMAATSNYNITSTNTTPSTCATQAYADYCPATAAPAECLEYSFDKTTTTGLCPGTKTTTHETCLAGTRYSFAYCAAGFDFNIPPRSASNVCGLNLAGTDGGRNFQCIRGGGGGQANACQNPQRIVVKEAVYDFLN